MKNQNVWVVCFCFTNTMVSRHWCPGEHRNSCSADVLNSLEFVNGKLHPDRLYTCWLLKGWEVIRKDQPWYCLNYCLQIQIMTYYIDLQCMCLWVFLSYRLFGRIGNFIAKWIGDKQQARNIKRQNREHPAKKESWPESHTQFSKQGYVSAYDLFENDFIESTYIYTTQKIRLFNCMVSFSSFEWHGTY